MTKWFKYWVLPLTEWQKSFLKKKQCEYFGVHAKSNSTSEMCTGLRRQFPELEIYKRTVKDGQIKFRPLVGQENYW